MPSINNMILNYIAREGDYLEINVIKCITRDKEKGVNVVFSYKEKYPNKIFYSDSGEVEISMKVDDLIKLQSEIDKFLRNREG